MIEDALDVFGRIDGLVCNAGVIDFADAQKLSAAAFHSVMDINFWGSVYPVMAALPVMAAEGAARSQ